jgi:hypothetical protein
MKSYSCGFLSPPMPSLLPSLGAEKFLLYCVVKSPLINAFLYLEQIFLQAV